MKASEKLVALLESLPAVEKGGLPSPADAEKVDKALAEILADGKDSLVGLVGLLVEPGKGNDAKARYLLHALAVRVGGGKDEKNRQQYAEALASTLGGDRPKEVQRFVVRQLQVGGGKEVAPALGKLLTDEELCNEAAQALVAIRTGAAEPLRTALPKATGKAKLAIVQALGVLADAGAAAELRKLATDKDSAVRQAAVWALANSGDAASVEVVIKAADAEGYERIAATKSCLLLAEKLLAAGKKREAARIYTHLLDTRKDNSEEYVREAAERGLAAAR